MIVQPEVASGGGGGSGATLSEFIGDFDESGLIYVDHPSVPMSGTGSGLIEFSGSATRAGDDFTANESSSWEYSHGEFELLNWVNDGGQTGHFTATPPATIVPGCEMVSGNAAWISTMGADPTLEGSVHVHGTNPPTGEVYVYYYRAAYYGWYSGIYTMFDQTEPTTAVNWGPTGFAYIYAGGVMADSADVASASEVRVRGSASYNGNNRAAISLDGAATWLSYSGTSWSTITLGELADEGLTLGTCDGNYNELSGANGETPNWAALLTLIQQAGEDLDVRLVFGVDMVGSRRSFNVEFYWAEASSIVNISVLPTGNGMGSVSYRPKRVSETRTEFSGSGMETGYSNFRCQVWTYEGE